MVTPKLLQPLPSPIPQDEQVSNSALHTVTNVNFPEILAMGSSLNGIIFSGNSSWCRETQRTVRDKLVITIYTYVLCIIKTARSNFTFVSNISRRTHKTKTFGESILETRIRSDNQSNLSKTFAPTLDSSYILNWKIKKYIKTDCRNSNQDRQQDKSIVSETPPSRYHTNFSIPKGEKTAIGYETPVRIENKPKLSEIVANTLTSGRKRILKNIWGTGFQKLESELKNSKNWAR